MILAGRGRWFFVFIGLLLLSGMVSVAIGADATPPESTKPAAGNKLDTGDNAWMLTSSALVLMMTGPGLALFYCGLVRKKNVLSVMMQCVFLMCLMTVIWAVYGYSLSFGGKGAWIGDLRHLFMNGVSPVWKDGQSVMPMWPDSNVPVSSTCFFRACSSSSRRH